MPIRRGVLALLGHRFGAKYRVRPKTIIQGRRLTLGADVSINRGCMIEAVGAITIGDEAGLGQDVLVLTVTHQVGHSRRRAGEVRTAPVTVGPGSWIGARSTLLPGVTVGAGAVVAAGAIVATDVPANTLVGGVPARLLRTLDGA
jgi:maltose O-acetyltransferase